MFDLLLCRPIFQNHVRRCSVVPRAAVRLGLILALVSWAAVPVTRSTAYAQEENAKLKAQASSDQASGKKTSDKKEKQSKKPRLEFKTRKVERAIIDYADDPFDELTVEWEEEGQKHVDTFRVFSLKKVPSNPKPDDRLRVRLLRYPDRQFDVEWKHIRGIKPYAELVFEEAQRLVAAKRYDEAFRYFDYLVRRSRPSTKILRAARDFIFANANDALQKKEYDRALGLFEELRRTNPNYRTKEVLDKIGQIADVFIRNAVVAQDYRTARGVLTRLRKQYTDEELPTLAQWQERLMQEARSRKEQAARLLAEKKYREAHRVGRDMLKIWPELEGARELTLEIQRQYPLVYVGVGQFAKQTDPRRIEDWAGRRVARLSERPLFQFLGPGPEGGRYRCSVGAFDQSDDRRQLTIDVFVPEDPEKAVVTGYDVARRLAEITDPSRPDYDPAWAALAERFSVEDVFQTRIDLRRPHVLPEGLMQVVLHPDRDHRPVGSPSEGPFLPAETNEQTVHFLANPRFAFGTEGHLKEVIERKFDDPDEAAAALLRGDIDMLDYVFPADVSRLMADDQIVVNHYMSPTLHFLVPNLERPFPGRPIFRRAVLYAINRDEILHRDILGNRVLDGYEVITGPFPKGIGPFDPLSYAYNTRLMVRGYNPQLSMVLKILAEKELTEIARRKEEPEPKFEKLILCYPANPLAKMACQSIAQYLGVVGLTCELRELPAGETRPADDDWDFFYAQVAVWEPIIDARRLLGTYGLGGTNDNYIIMALRKLDHARNWRQVRQRLHNIHQIVYDQLTVIPLYQTVDYFAHSIGVEGVPDHPVLLYETVEQWQVVPRIPRN